MFFKNKLNLIVLYSRYKVILINVQKILNKYVHMLSYMSCIEGAHYDNRIQCNHRFTYTVC